MCELSAQRRGRNVYTIRHGWCFVACLLLLPSPVPLRASPSLAALPLLVPRRPGPVARWQRSGGSPAPRHLHDGKRERRLCGFRLRARCLSLLQLPHCSSEPERLPPLATPGPSLPPLQERTLTEPRPLRTSACSTRSGLLPPFPAKTGTCPSVGNSFLYVAHERLLWPRE